MDVSPCGGSKAVGRPGTSPELRPSTAGEAIHASGAPGDGGLSAAEASECGAPLEVLDAPELYGAATGATAHGAGAGGPKGGA